MILTPAEVSQFITTSETNNEDNKTTKHDKNKKNQRRNSSNAIHPNDIELNDYEPPKLLVFNISTSTVSYGNGKHRVKTKVFEVKCHPAHTHTLKTLLARSSLSSDPETYDSNKYFPYKLSQVVDKQVYKQ